ncbi:MAG: Fis family sigma-54 specific transcriptional regulator [bacterium]|nr:MAG: Fis family sigma-54 specific transcriptional regulator [bacterium]
MLDQTPSKPNLDTLSMATIDALYQGDEARLEKISTELKPLEQEIFRALINCWHSDATENSTPLSDLICVSEKSESIFPSLIIAEKSLELGDIKTHDDFILRVFPFIDKCEKKLEKKLFDFYKIIKIKGFITDNSLDKAVYLVETLADKSDDKFTQGYRFYLLGLISKLKGKRHHSKAQHYLRQAISIFEIHQPNRYLLNLSKLHLALFLETSPEELSQIAQEFKKLGCSRETNLALAEYNYITKFTKGGLVTQDFTHPYARVDNYYFIGESMKDCLRRLTTMASATRGNVLILGEEGTGKEVFAHTIYKLSDRTNKPFTIVNCSQLKNELFELEFFGCEKGAYTGATSQKRGLLEECQGGMIFLDEIAELTPQIQAKLLTVLQSGKFRRIGSNNEITVNIRFIGATNRELKKMIERDKANREANDPNIRETFRSDLSSRFPWKITVPSLDKRREEILYLAQVFLAELAPNEQFILDNSAKEYLFTRNYPSNIRSLKDFLNCTVTYAKENNLLLITDKVLLQAESFMEIEIEIDSNDLETSSLTFQEQVKRFETNLLRKTLIQYNHNVALAAKRLGLAKTTFYDYLKRHNVNSNSSTNSNNNENNI